MHNLDSEKSCPSVFLVFCSVHLITMVSADALLPWARLLPSMTTSTPCDRACEALCNKAQLQVKSDYYLSGQPKNIPGSIKQTTQRENIKICDIGCYHIKSLNNGRK
ncbi:hypothetical protein V8F33_006876 [Rhypophila sp. PSN 637]